MRYGLLIAGLVALSAPAQAASRAAYVTMVLQAFAAKVECPGTVFKLDGEPPQAVPGFLERDPTRELVARVVSTGNVG